MKVVWISLKTLFLFILLFLFFIFCLFSFLFIFTFFNFFVAGIPFHPLQYINECDIPAAENEQLDCSKIDMAAMKKQWEASKKEKAKSK